MSARSRRSELNPWSTAEARAAVAQRLIQQKTEDKQHKRSARRQCSYCLEKSTKSLQTCALCKSVSYCNKTCQIADYKRGHKRECQEFIHPPFVPDFVPEAIGDMKYERNPVFALGHNDGVGCWVSISGRADADLRSLTEHMMPPEKPRDITVRNEMISRDPALATRTRAYDGNLLTLHVLVQSRRKDGAAVAVFPAQTMLESRALPESIATLMGGKAVEGDRIATFRHATGEECAMVGVVQDPWSKNPRVFLSSLDGKPNNADLPSLPGVLNPATGSVLLKPGQFALYHIQFRVGDSASVYAEWHALKHIIRLYLPVAAPWLPTDREEVTERILADRFGRAGASPAGVHVLFNQPAMIEYYRDYIIDGKVAFVKSHYGAERAQWMQKGERELERRFKEMAERLVQKEGSVESGIQSMRAAGQHSAAAMCAALARVQLQMQQRRT